MRIGIDCRTILSPQKDKSIGVGHYTYQLVRHLLKIDKKNQYILFFDRSVEKKRLDKFKAKNAEVKFFPFQLYQKFLSMFFTSQLEDAFFEREKLDVLHSPSIDLPPNYKGKTIITVHDVASFRFPKYYEAKLAAERKQKFPKIIQQADKIIAVSQITKKELNKLLKVPFGKIKVIYHGVDDRFFRRPKIKDIEQVKKKYRIQGDYILFLSKIDKRKNYEGVIKSFVKFKKQNKKYIDYKLVMAGQWSDHFKQDKDKLVKLAQPGDIVLTGYIASGDIGPIYRGAKLFLMPSVYEGFGLPIIEAMAKGIPVVTSNTFAAPEVAGRAAILVNPHKIDDIAQGIKKVLDNKKLALDLQKKGLKRARQFSWDKCARETLSYYQQFNKSGHNKP